VLALEWESAEDGQSTLDLAEDSFTSTIQGVVEGDMGADELDDAEIERSIREINEAIKRSAQHRKS
jgi:hypothetical protein